MQIVAKLCTLLQNFNVKSEGKISSLRSIRVKPERQRDKTCEKRSINNNNNINSQDLVVKDEPKDTESPVIIEKIKVEPECGLVMKKEEPDDKAAVIIEKIKTEDVQVKQEVSDEKAKMVEECPKPVDIIKIKQLPMEIKSEPTKGPADGETTSQVYMHEVKRRKLDILKEGGLEVTPVRPSVIHQATIPATTPGLISNGVPYPAKCLPPMAPTPPSHTRLSPKMPPPPPFFKNGAMPPRVVQSRSIYSYSEKTIYGNPKDIIGQNAVSPVVRPKFASSAQAPRPSGGDLLDLSVNSPHKPVVEIMRIPQVPSTSHSRDTRNLMYQKPATARRGGSSRMGSNLEITLVPQQNNNKPLNHYYPQSKSKRISNEPKSVEVPKYPSKPSPIMPTTNNNNKTKMFPLAPTPHQLRLPDAVYKSYPTHLPSNVPAFVPPPMFYDGQKEVPRYLGPYFSLLPDPMFYMRSIYSNNMGFPPTPPIFPMSTEEEFNGRMADRRSITPYPVQKMPDNGSSSINSRKS